MILMGFLLYYDTIGTYDYDCTLHDWGIKLPSKNTGKHLSLHRCHGSLKYSIWVPDEIVISRALYHVGQEGRRCETAADQ